MMTHIYFTMSCKRLLFVLDESCDSPGQMQRTHHPQAVPYILHQGGWENDSKK